MEMIQFKRMKVKRERAEPIEVDGELLEMGKEFTIEVMPDALYVIDPRETKTTAAGDTQNQ